MTAALGAASQGDILSFRVCRVGGEVRIPGGPYSIDDSATFSAHLQSGSTGVEGTVEFTGDDPVTIDGGGQVRRRANLTVKFKAVMIGANGSDPYVQT